MNKKTIRGSLLLVITAILWGGSYVAHTLALNFVGPFSLGTIRFLFGAVCLIPVVFVSDYFKRKNGATKQELRKSKKNSLLWGSIFGVMLGSSTCLMYIGLQYTTAGNAGFIATLHIIIVPIVGIFIGKKVGLNVWLAVAIALVGLFLISMTDGLSVNLGDALMLIYAAAAAARIILIDKYAKDADGVFMSFIQILVAGLTCVIPMLIVGEKITLDAFVGSLPYVLYSAIFSCGVGFTLQILGQKDVSPALSSVILSLEGVFAFIFGAIILTEPLSPRKIIGACVMLVALLLAQINPFKRRKPKEEEQNTEEKSE